jgi:hypothetical protein
LSPEEADRLLTAIRERHKFFSQDLINNLFFHPYTKIDFLEKDLKVSRLITAGGGV